MVEAAVEVELFRSRVPAVMAVDFSSLDSWSSLEDTSGWRAGGGALGVRLNLDLEGGIVALGRRV